MEIKMAAEYIKEKIKGDIDCAIILGSGLGEWGETIKEKIVIPYSEIKGMPLSKVQGHSNCFIYGKVGNKKVLAMKGRIHLYEGFEAKDVVFPIRIMKYLNVDKLIITNAAGGVNLNFSPGDLMLITDQINLSGHNSLRGMEALEFGERFPSMSHVYDKDMMNIAIEAAKSCNIALQQGVYFYSVGPSFETPAEIRAIRTLGADAVGMSTVHESTAAVQQGMRVMGLSCITNMAAGILDQPLTHKEVLETGMLVKDKFELLINTIIAKL